MPKFVKSILGRIYGSPEGVDPHVYNCLRAALSPLDKIEASLGKRAAAPGPRGGLRHRDRAGPIQPTHCSGRH